MIKEPTFEAMPQNVARLEEKVDALTETVNKLSQHIFSFKASARDEEIICVEDASKLLHLSPSRIYACRFPQNCRLPPNGVPLDFDHFRQRAIDFNGEDLNQEVFIGKLTDRLATTDINMVKNDVLPFIKNPSELDIWSNDYFVHLARMMKFQADKK